MQVERDLQSRVVETLRESGLPDLLQLTVNMETSRVVLHGNVHTYHAKQLAQSLARSVPGVTSLRNEIEVQRSRAPL